LSVTTKVLEWEGASNVIFAALNEYYPVQPDFLLRNLRVSLERSNSLEAGTIFWIILGAAGIFIPLEAGLNRLWKVHEDRPYWMNQLVGFILTAACTFLALFFVTITTVIQSSFRLFMPLMFMREVSDYVILKSMAVLLFATTILLFYKFLPNKKISTRQVLPAAFLAGIVAELVKGIYSVILPLLNLSSSQGSQGPYYISISFVVLAYFETFVVLGGAFLATHTELDPWHGFIRKWVKNEVAEAPLVIPLELDKRISD
jgi:uncharacterized BrkB/YihY/UPF0761 family membrane protein